MYTYASPHKSKYYFRSFQYSCGDAPSVLDATTTSAATMRRHAASFQSDLNSSLPLDLFTYDAFVDDDRLNTTLEAGAYRNRRAYSSRLGLLDRAHGRVAGGALPAPQVIRARGV